MKEEWRPIKGFEGYYEISNHGRVRSLDRLRKSVKGMAKVNGKIISGNHGENHYYQVVLFREGKSKTALVHRLVAEAFIPNPENKPQVNHKDGDKHNNNVNNLEWVTRSENQIHAYRTGLHPGTGEGNVNAKLTREQVAEIRRTYVKGRRGSGATILARKYGVKKHAILSIIWGDTWKGVGV